MKSRAGARTCGRWVRGSALAVLAAAAVAGGPPTEAWEFTHDGGAGNDYGRGVAIDSAGSVITAGYVAETLVPGPGTGANGFVVKRDHGGVPAWTQTIDNPDTDTVASASGDDLRGLCVAPDDDLIAVGAWSGDYATMSYWVTAYVAKLHGDTGDVDWEWRAGSGGGPWSTMEAAATDAAGNIIAVGQTVASVTSGSDWGIWKLSPEGQLAAGFPKSHSQSTGPYMTDLPYGVATYADGSFLVVGTVAVSPGPDSTRRDFDWHVRCYRADGSLSWTDTYAGPAHLYDTAFGVAIDHDGYAYVVGRTNVGTDNADDADYDGLVIKYTLGGQRVWTVVQDGDAGELHDYRGLAIDPDGTLSICGFHRGAGESTYGGWLEGRNPENGDLYGGDEDGAAANTYYEAVAGRNGMLAVAGSRVASDRDLLTRLLEIPNSAPVIDTPPAAGTDLGAVDEPIVFAIGAHDPDHDPLTYTWDFGDGTYATGPSPNHAFATPGQKMVDVTVSDGLHDVQDSLVLTVGQPVETPSVKAKVSFKKGGRDAVTFKCRLDLTEMLLIEGETVIVDVGGVRETFTLNKKGKGKSDAGKVTLKWKKKQQRWQLTAVLKNGDFAGDWADEGLVDETQKKTPVVIKATVELGVGIQCAHRVDALYTAKAGKWGKTR